jgi:anion-transporting  ArsA/GET3 family ATPase
VRASGVGLREAFVGGKGGVDEAMSFAEVLKQVKSLSYEVIIFDTAPTGHTLRFLQFPAVLGQYRYVFGGLELSSAPVAHPLQQIVVTLISCGLVAIL